MSTHQFLNDLILSVISYKVVGNTARCSVFKLHDPKRGEERDAGEAAIQVRWNRVLM